MKDLEEANRSPERAIRGLVDVMTKLRSPEGCPWDRQQDHHSLRYHAVEEVYELLDAIERQDDQEMIEELGDLLLQVVFHAQVANERGAFDFTRVAEAIVEKLVRRHPHVFGESQVDGIDSVWAQWETIKHQEKEGTDRERASALDGVPAHLPALLKAEKLIKKARKAKLTSPPPPEPNERPQSQAELGERLFALVAWAQEQGWSPEEAMRGETERRKHDWQAEERRRE